MAETINISRLLKYCLEYVRLTTRSADISRLRNSYGLSKEYLPLKELLSLEDIEPEKGRGILINLPNFYDIDPKDIIPERKQDHKIEKEIAEHLEDVMNAAKNDMYTKELTMAFGHFDIEIPITEEETGETAEDAQQDQLFKSPTATKICHPLYSLPIRLEKHDGKYYILPSDTQIRTNTSALFDVLGDRLYFEFVGFVGKLEDEGDFELPVGTEKLVRVWNKLREHLRLTDANFNDESFQIDSVRIGLAPRVNYFLSEDLTKLVKLDQEKLGGTALSGWSDEDTEADATVPNEGELFFPFIYDKWQLNTLRILSKRIAIIEGPPGTGKSQTISNLLCHLAAKGKRVLFVSQKAQALKVVKDMLKETGIQYLFGYIPNIHSELLRVEDESDGIAPQLAGLNNYLHKIEASRQKRQSSDVVSAASQKVQTANQFNSSLDTQREYFHLTTEIDRLVDYNLHILDTDSFLDNQTSQRLTKLSRCEQHLSTIIGNMETISTDLGQRLKAFEGRLGHVLSWDWVDSIEELAKDIEGTGYDGHFIIRNWLNNTTRKIRKSKDWNSCPREIRDELDRILSSGRSLSLNVREVRNLANYVKLQHHKSEKRRLESEIKDLLSKSGIDASTWEAFRQITRTGGITEATEKVQGLIRLKNQLAALKIESPSKIIEQWKKAEITRCKRVSQFIQNLLDPRLTKQSESQGARKIIATFAKHLKKSKRAFKTFDRLRREKDAFGTVLSLVPIWIMELDDSSRIVPLEPGIFNYVIFDEASQCNLAFAMPAMFRAERAVFVGDSYQMRDDSIRFKSNRAFDEIAKRFDVPNDLRIKTTGESVQSVLDIARACGFKSVTLRNHYRSPRELIGFSNKYFYKPNGRELYVLNSDYRTYNNSSRIIVLHQLNPNLGLETSDKTNFTEASKAVDLIKQLRSTHGDLSIGVLSFFNAQASLIRQLAEKAGLDEERDNFKVSTIEGIGRAPNPVEFLEAYSS